MGVSHMSAYVIVDIAVHDLERYEEYKAIAAPTVHQYDGKYIVRGGRAEQLEGERSPSRVVVLEFPTFARAKEWWASPEYAPAKVLRHETASSEMLLVEG
jgi:uncharacterized protein (DUF1330 family)